ncbi:hypothetical protein A6D6_00347 [Alcanivorax xiamenensis]|uniref:Uncharacterized protein n=1 Tax=Alcanivorax xiamenensis TaxID=1177156 RepID=A0ABQ6YCK5_9GAMM|nr:hypothetical protein A6D6_00347 [Alcanivorax xiamenensis]
MPPPQAVAGLVSMNSHVFAAKAASHKEEATEPLWEAALAANTVCRSGSGSSQNDGVPVALLILERIAMLVA